MKYTLIDINEQLCLAWEKVFAGIDEVEVQYGSVFEESRHALVSPANSFGYMNGGIDFAISKHLGWHLEKRLQAIIRERHHGELLVGQSVILPTDQERYPWLIAAPTMRLPMTIVKTPNVYLAMKAILICCKFGQLPDGSPVADQLQSVAIPGLGTGIGQMPVMDAARQMRIAWEDIQNEKFRSKETWEEMGSNFAYFYTGDTRNLKYDIP